MKIRHAVVVLMFLSVVGVLVAPSASARWAIHNGADATNPLPAPGGTDAQTCPDRARARSGWSAFVEAPKTPQSFTIPPEAFGRVDYEIFGATGGHTFDGVQPKLDSLGNPTGDFVFTDGTTVPKLARFTTALRTKLTPPELISGDASGGVYAFTSAPIDQPLPPGAVAPGDKIAFRPVEGFTFVSVDVINCESTKPACTLTKKTSAGIEVTLQDTGTGLKSVQVTKAVNAAVTVPPFTVGTKTPLVVKANKVNPTLASQVALRVRDVQGNVSDCDPVLTTLVKERTPQVITGVPGAEHLVTITNGDPGLRRVTVTVNGTQYRRRVSAGQELTIDVSRSITADSNTFKLRGWGRGSADIMIWDGQGTV